MLSSTASKRFANGLPTQDTSNLQFAGENCENGIQNVHSVARVACDQRPRARLEAQAGAAGSGEFQLFAPCRVPITDPERRGVRVLVQRERPGRVRRFLRRLRQGGSVLSPCARPCRPAGRRSSLYRAAAAEAAPAATRTTIRSRSSRARAPSLTSARPPVDPS